MVQAQLPVSKTQHAFCLGDLPFANIISPYLHKGESAFSTFRIRPNGGVSESFRVDLRDTGPFCAQLFDAAIKTLSLPDGTYPYNLTSAQWQDYAVSPHSYLSLGRGTYQIGLNYFTRFMHLDINHSTVRLLDPGVGDDFLSTTNWFDEASNELWFASWNAVDTIRRNVGPRENVSVRIWKRSVTDKRLTPVWNGMFGDAIHQLAVSPDRTFLVAAELGLRPDRSFPPSSLVPSSVMFLSLETGRHWLWNLPAAAHVEFDPADPAVCYLSGHNIGFVGPKVGIFGPGVICKARMTPDGPQPEKSFTHPDFYRITTHIVFSHREKTLIAASGYPGSIFLIDASSMQLFKIIEITADDPVDCSCGPHVCAKDSYGLCASDDGRYIMAPLTGRLRIVDVDTGHMVREEPIPGNCSFTGHAAPMRTTWS